jgi:2-phospho-L-lactate guanylyltransferase
MPVLPTAIIPLKALSDAKGRLADALGTAQRRELAGWMFERVLRACASTPHIGDVLVIAGDEESAAVARPFEVRTVIEHRPGLRTAMALADELLADHAATLVIAADLPLLSATDIAAVCDAASAGAAVVIAPTHDGGTGGLLRLPPQVIRTAFGHGSAAAHRRLADAAGVASTVVRTEGFSLDIDTPRQLGALADLGLAWPR